MSAILFKIPDDPAGRNAFSWDHAMQHRKLMVAMGPLTQWSKMPYWHDLMQYDARPATMWHTNHQQAHNDFTTYLPAYWDQAHGDWTANPGIPTNQILVETNLNEPGSRRWWEFANHHEHFIAANAMFPLPLQPTAPPIPPATWQIVWWLQAPRLQWTYW